MLLGPAWANASDDELIRACEVMSKTIGIDMHNHVYPRNGTAIRSKVRRGRRRSKQQGPNFSWRRAPNVPGLPPSVLASCWTSRKITSPAMRENNFFAGSRRSTRSLKGHIPRADLKVCSRAEHGQPTIRPDGRRRSSSRAPGRWKRRTTRRAAPHCFNANDMVSPLAT